MLDQLRIFLVSKNLEKLKAKDYIVTSSQYRFTVRLK